MMEVFRKENEDEDSEEFKRDIQLQKKYFCSWGCGKQNQHHVMEMYKINLVKKFKFFCDEEKWKLKGLCSETKSYFQNLWLAFQWMWVGNVEQNIIFYITKSHVTNKIILLIFYT